MDRAIPRGSKICAAREEMRRQQMHRERIMNIKSTVDTSKPLAQTLNHVVNNLKREQKLEERYTEIDRENRILLSKMSEIMRQQPGAGTLARSGGSTLTPREPPPGPQSLNRDARKKELLRITKENLNILKRIQEAQPVYNHVEFEGAHRRKQGYLKNCAEYPIVLGTPRKTPRAMGAASSELVPLQPDTSHQATEEITQASSEMRLLLKEGARISDRHYMVEIMTDGARLHVSAYDNSTQEAMELILREKAHRKLYREINGDYSLVLKRLEVDKQSHRLVLQDDPSQMAPVLPPVAPQVKPQALGLQQAITQPLAPTLQAPAPAPQQAWAPEPQQAPAPAAPPSWQPQQKEATPPAPQSADRQSAGLGPSAPVSAGRGSDLSPQEAGMDADHLVMYTRGSISAGTQNSAYAEVGFDAEGDPQVRFRGLTPSDATTPSNAGRSGQNFFQRGSS